MTRVGHSLKQIDLRGPFDVIVVGSGIGALVCAGLLAKHGGKRVLVLERHYTAGGFTHSFERPGYDWDVGVHYIGQVLTPNAPLRRLLDHVGDGSLAWADLGEVYDLICIGRDEYEFARGREPFRERMHACFPKERKAIDEYLALTRKVATFCEVFFADRGMPSALGSVLGPLLRAPVNKYARATTGEVMDGLGMSQRLKAVLTGNFGDYGLPPAQGSFMMQALLAEHYREGAGYPVGGASRIAASIVPTIEAAGGAVVTSAAVSQILVKNGQVVGVRLEHGEEWHAPIVISDAGVRITCERLLAHELRAMPALGELVSDVSASIASLTLYLGFEGTPDELGLPRHNLWMYPHDDHDKSFTFVTKNEFLPGKQEPLPVAFCSFAAARDPEFQKRHPGHSTGEIITVSDARWFRRWEETHWKKRGGDYEAMKEEWTNRLLEPLLTRMPQLRSKIRHAELSTPLSTAHFASHPQGEIYGLAHTPARFMNRALRAETPIKGLFLTGSDIVACGVAGGAGGGVIAACRVLSEDVRGLFRTRQPSAPGYSPRVRERVEPRVSAEAAERR